MVKKLIMLVALVALLCVPVQADLLSSWIWGDGDVIGARIGGELTKDVEIGLSTLWFPDREKPVAWGIYGVYHLGEVIQFPNPFMIDFLPETISGRPYFGGKLDIDYTDLQNYQVSPIAGIIFADVIFIEYQFESIDRTMINESKLIFGLRFNF